MAADHSVRTSIPASAPAAAGPTAPAPPKKPRLSPERLAARLARMDAVLIVLVLVSAFLLAAFPATNGDLLQHFAVGRRVMDGKYQFGVDPFTFTTEGVYWANHSWLFGLIAYGLYSIPAIGGAFLVIVKALLTCLLAAVMLRCSWRPGERLWLSATVTGIAVLALSSQLYLRPVIISFLFLGLTVWFLIRPALQTAPVRITKDTRKKGRPAGKPIPFKAYWPLPALCLFWVNLDQWFFLGPLTIGLYLAGVALQERFWPLPRSADDPVEEPKTLGLVLLASVVACFVSPHHYHSFVVPAQLGFGQAAEAVRDLRQFQPTFLSPLSFGDSTHDSYFRSESPFNSAAYFVLLLLGVISFILSYGVWRWWRVMVWAFFVLLSLYHARAIPFFAVVAAPITALNFLDYTFLRFGRTYLEGQNARSWAVSGRVLSLFLAVLLCVAAVPGWTHVSTHRLHHFGLRVEFDPSLRDAAEKVAEWRKEGKLPANIHWFNTSPDVVNYFAWFCPGEKGFFDHRLALFDKVAGDYAKARKLLLKLSEEPAHAQETVRELRELFDEQNIDFVACYDTDLRFPNTALNSLLSRPDQWPRVYGRGKTGLFWRQGSGVVRNAEDIRGLMTNDVHAAFGPGAAPAPRNRPGRAPEPREWYEELWMRPHPLYNSEADDAWFHLRAFDARAPFWAGENFHRLQASLAASLMGWTFAGDPHVFEAVQVGYFFYTSLKEGDKPTPMQVAAAKWHDAYLGGFPGSLDNGPPASLYLALRAARRALHKNPDDAATYLLLGYVYFALQARTREGGFAPTELAQIRLAQSFGALQQAVRLDNDLIEAHELLARRYQDLGFLDLRLKHVREILRILQEKEDTARRSGADLSKRIQALDELVQKLDEAVKRQNNNFEVAVANKSQAEVARGLSSRQQSIYGLGERTLELLRKFDYKELSEKDREAAQAAGQMLLELLFVTGQVDEIRELVKRGSDLQLGPSLAARMPAVEWARIRLAAVTGDYGEADEELAKQIAQVAGSTDRKALAEQVRDILLKMAPRATGLAGPLPAALDAFELVVAFRQTPPELRQALADRYFAGASRYPDQGHWFLAKDNVVQGILAPVQREAELRALRGWLALEAGDTREAAAQLRSAFTLRLPPERALPPLLVLGASCPLEIVTSRVGTSPLTYYPPFNFSGQGLAYVGLQWLEAQEK
jgi:hypothetical protein